MELPERRPARTRGARTGRHRGGGQAGFPGAGPGRHPGRWPRAARGPARPGQDADRALVRAGARPGLPPAAVHPRPAARRRHRLVPLRPAPARLPFRAGPVFTNLLLADEINRTPPKTQAALLEAMQEKQVSVEGVTYRLDPPFHVLATANPIEYEGTYPLPEAQLDRFLLRVSFGYPEPRRGVGGAAPADGPPARGGDRSSRWSTRGTLLGMQAALEDVAVEDSVGRYIVGLDRGHPGAPLGAGRRLAARLAGAAAAPAPGRRSPAATTWCPRTSRTWRCPRWPPDHAAAGDVAAPGRPRLRRRGALGPHRRAALRAARRLLRWHVM